jgi:hypothetical protein
MPCSNYRELIDGLSDNGDGRRERGRWAADPADAWALRGIPGCWLAQRA